MVALVPTVKLRVNFISLNHYHGLVSTEQNIANNIQLLMNTKHTKGLGGDSLSQKSD